MSKFKKRIRVIAVCEDSVAEGLIRRYLLALGYNRWQIRCFTAPRGKGSGEQFVRAKFGAELRSYRKGKAKNRCLIAHIDADVGTVQNRVNQLTEGQDSRKRDESIVFLIPKRNIETWIHHLLGNTPNEIEDYSRLYKNRLNQTYCQPAAAALIAIVRDPNNQLSLPSLQLAVAELRDKLSGTS